jgi:hypothetical protein
VPRNRFEHVEQLTRGRPDAGSAFAVQRQRGDAVGLHRAAQFGQFANRPLQPAGARGRVRVLFDAAVKPQQPIPFFVELLLGANAKQVPQRPVEGADTPRHRVQRGTLMKAVWHSTDDHALFSKNFFVGELLNTLLPACDTQCMPASLCGIAAPRGSAPPGGAAQGVNHPRYLSSQRGTPLTRHPVTHTASDFGYTGF